MRETATGERSALEDTPTMGSLRDLTTVQATRTAQAKRGGRESEWGGGKQVRLLSRTMRHRRRDARRECQLVRRSVRVQS